MACLAKIWLIFLMSVAMVTHGMATGPRNWFPNMKLGVKRG